MRNKNQTEAKRPVSRTVFRVFILLLISLIAGGAIYSFNARQVLHDQMPMPLGFGVSYVLSPSMEPTLRVDDLVFIRSSDSYREGDIVIFQESNSLTIHRIIHVDGDTVTTKGDNNNSPDAPIQKSSIKGKLVFSVPFLGALVRLLQTTVAKILLIVLAALLFKLSWRKEKKQDDETLEQMKAEIRRLKAQQLPESEAEATSSESNPEENASQPVSQE